MKTLLVIAIIFPIFCKAQKVYTITGLSMFGPQYQNLSPVGKAVAKVKDMTIIITDSSFIQNVGKRSDTFRIVKKVNEHYFKMTDGLKESIVNIQEPTTFKKYTGAITIEADDKNKTIMFYK